jgi:O-antigen/teichoic acid export membrane protein
LALGSPLYRSGYALIANVAGTTIVGLGFWAVATHLYSPRHVGEASALVAALVVVSSFAQLNLNNTLPRFLTQAGRRAGRLIGYGYAASTAAGVVIALAVVTLLPALSPHWHFLGASVPLIVAFVAGTVVWGIFALQDYALLGLQRPLMVPLENTVYGVAKLLMLLGLASFLPSSGVFIAWVLPLAINVPAVNWLIFRRYLKDWEPGDYVATVRPRDIVKFSSVDYVGNLLIQAAGNLLPLLVLTVIGAASAAAFYIAWTITTGLNLVANSFATSLLVQGSANVGKLGELTRGTVTRTLAVTLAGATVFGLGARLILGIYGNGYAIRASLLLGLLAAGSVFYGLLAVIFSIDRIVGRVGRATATRFALAILTLGGSSILLPRLGTDGVGIAWLGSNLLAAVVRIPTIFSASRLKAGASPARSGHGSPMALLGLPARSRAAGRHRRGTTPSPVLRAGLRPATTILPSPAAEAPTNLKRRSHA